MISMVVVLPAPLGPSSPKQVPSGTLKDTPSTAVVAGYSLTRSRTSRIVGLTAGLTALQTPARDPSGFAASRLALWRRLPGGVRRVPSQRMTPPVSTTSPSGSSSPTRPCTGTSATRSPMASTCIWRSCSTRSSRCRASTTRCSSSSCIRCRSCGCVWCCTSSRRRCDCVRHDDLDPALKMLARISRTQTQLISVWEVLSTLTPFEYSAFRNALGRSSGFQSFQYRLIEFLFGNKNADMVRVHQRDARSFEILQRALESPSLYDEVLRLLSRRGYEIPAGLPHARFQPALPRQQAGRGRLAWRLSQRRQAAGTCTSWPNASSTSITTSSYGASIT